MPVLWTRQSFHNRNNPGVDLTPGLLHKYMIISITQGNTGAFCVFDRQDGEPSPRCYSGGVCAWL